MNGSSLVAIHTDSAIERGRFVASSGSMSGRLLIRRALRSSLARRALSTKSQDVPRRGGPMARFPVTAAVDWSV